MSQLTMQPSAVRTNREVFSKKSPFNLYLMFQKVVELKKSPKKGIPFLLSKDEPIWIANKLKDQALTNPEAFARELTTNGGDYEIGLSIPSAEFPTESWILYKRGEVPQAETLATIRVADLTNAETTAQVKP